MAVTTYRTGAHLFVGRALSEFLTKTGQPTDRLARAQQNFGFAGPLGAWHVDVTLTQAQIQGMNTTPVILIPAVAGVTYVLEGPLFFRYTFATAAYAAGGAITLQYHIGPTAASVVLPATALGAASTENIVNALPNSTVNVVPTIGDQVEITNATAAFTGGGGTLRVAFTYLIY